MAKGLKIALALAAWLMMPVGAWAQTAVGSSVVDGRTVTLYSDGTWDFAVTSDSDCKEMTRGLSFCGAPPLWTPTPPPNAMIAAQYSRSASDYVQFINEEIGSERGVTMEMIKRGVIAGTAGSLGQRPEDIPVLSDTPGTFNNHESTRLVYAVTFSGTPIVFANTLVLMPDRTVQLMSFVVGATGMTPEHDQLHAQMLELVRLN